MAPGIWQILIVVVLVALLFGAGRISGLMGEVAKGITSFRKGLKEGAEDEDGEADAASISEDAPAETSGTVREEEKTRE